MDDPVQFLIDNIIEFLSVLDDYEFLNVPIAGWIFAFIVVNMVISIFWRGARG